MQYGQKKPTLKTRIRRVLLFPLRLTPTKSRTVVYTRKGKKFARQSWGEYFYSKLSNYIRFRIKYGKGVVKW